MRSSLEPVTTRKASVATVEAPALHPVDQDNFGETIHDAQIATTKEHSMSLRKGVKLYPKANGWSILLSTAIVMEGYDVVLMGSFYALEPFNRKYGNLPSDGTYQLTASWQAGLSNAMNVGQILGLFITGIISERFGYRKTMLGALTSVVAFIFVLFFAQNTELRNCSVACEHLLQILSLSAILLLSGIQLQTPAFQQFYIVRNQKLAPR